MTLLVTWAVVLGVMFLATLLFQLWEHFVTDPRERAREERWRAWEQRQRDYDPMARYGDHLGERAKYAEVIRAHGDVCMERICIMPSRRIEPGAFWHLAHDHQGGGQHDYLGPAHPECNEHEAHLRGVTWEGPDRTLRPSATSADDDDLWRRSEPDLTC